MGDETTSRVMPDTRESPAPHAPLPIEILRCPTCREPLAPAGSGLDCARCATRYPFDEGVACLVSRTDGERDDAGFYSAADPARYGRQTFSDPFGRAVGAFLADVPREGCVLEIGSGAGALDAVHPGYVACDLSLYALKAFSSGARVQADATALPFASGGIDAIVSRATLEHVPHPERALAEVERCLKPGGKALLFPAWFVRPWASRALHVRAYRELSLRERIEKLTIPVRDSRPFWAAKVLPSRLGREAALRRQGRELPFTYRRLKPNLDEHLTSDSDAFSSMDPHALAAYFISRGYEDLRRPTAWRRLMYGYEPVVVRKPSGVGESR